MAESSNKKYMLLSLAIGMVIGSAGTLITVKASQVEQSERQQAELLKQHQQQLEALTQELNQKNEAIKALEDNSRLMAEQHQQKVETLEKALADTQVEKEQVEKTLVKKKQQTQVLATEKKKLQKTTQLQTDLYKESHQLFSQEKQLKTELEKQQSLQSQLTTLNQKLAKECALFKEGASWDAKSNSCEKEKLAKEQLTKLQTSIAKKQQELDKIQALIKELGIKESK